VSTDANGAFYHFVRIELKSAEPRLFAPSPGNDAPNCSFVVEAPQGSTVCTAATTCGVRRNTSVLFQSTSSDPDGQIVRYDWYWGDGTPNNDSPDTNHVFRTLGTFDIIHRVTDNNGAVAACTGTIEVVP
jgi:bacillopeptidase F